MSEREQELRESLKQAKDEGRATAKTLKITEAAAAEGLRAAEEMAKERERQGKTSEAEAIRSALAAYGRAYEAISGKRPRAKEANADKIGEFAKEIMEARQRLAITQQELAERAGLTFATINRLERGKQTATITTRRKIRRAIERLEEARNKSQTAERKKRR